MVLPLEKLYTAVKAELEIPQPLKSVTETPSVPDVDPNGAGLEDVFAWGEAVSRLGHITPERSGELLKLARKLVKNRS